MNFSKSFIYYKIKNNITKLIKFCIVGLTGLLVNLVFYSFCSQHLNVNFTCSSIIAFTFAVTNNYVLNHMWTFREGNLNSAPNYNQYIKYVYTNLCGLFINLVTLNLAIILAGNNSHHYGQLCGIALGVIFNFILAKNVVFKNKNA